MTLLTLVSPDDPLLHRLLAEPHRPAVCDERHLEAHTVGQSLNAILELGRDEVLEEPELDRHRAPVNAQTDEMCVLLGRTDADALTVC